MKTKPFYVSNCKTSWAGKTWIFSPGHAGVTGNEGADSLTGSAAIDNYLVLDPPTVLQCVKENLIQNRPPSSSYTVSRLKEKNVQPGEGANCTHRGATRRRHNQLLTETISLHTLRWVLMERSERLWGCPCCDDLDSTTKWETKWALKLSFSSFTKEKAWTDWKDAPCSLCKKVLI